MSAVHDAPSVDPYCSFTVERPVMTHGWLDLTFLHWRYPVDVVQRLLPPGLQVDAFDGSAWVALVPFRMRVGFPGVGAVPWLSRFPETNVRTYARAEDGSTGVYFLSLEASRLAAVATARAAYALPYFWADMSIEQTATHVDYATSRRWPGPRGASSKVGIDVGERFGRDELGDFDHWLTARYRLFTRTGRGLTTARAVHDPWVLHRGAVTRLDDELIEAAGLPAPVGDPLVHWSPGVEVRIGRPERRRSR